MAIPTSIKHNSLLVSFWNRVIETPEFTKENKKPRNPEELNSIVKTHILEQHANNYEGIFPTPDSHKIYQHYEKIRNAPAELAADFPPEWHDLRLLDQESLKGHITDLCPEITKRRKKILEESGNYLLQEMKKKLYKPEEVAELLYISSKVSPKGKIGKDNEHMPITITGVIAKKTLTFIKEGYPSQKALIKAKEETSAKPSATNTNGWKKYPKSNQISAAKTLQKDLESSTWCTGGDLETAKTHLNNGDFYVFFVKGKPEIAIRTNDNLVQEIRGNGPGQALSTEPLHNEAENFLRSKKGPLGGEEYLWDQTIRKALLNYNENETLNPSLSPSPILLQGFNQNGEWILENHGGLKPKMGSYECDGFEETYIQKIKRRILTEEEIYSVDPQGQIHIHTSFILQNYTVYNTDIQEKRYSQNKRDLQTNKIKSIDGNLYENKDFITLTELLNIHTKKKYPKEIEIEIEIEKPINCLEENLFPKLIKIGGYIKTNRAELHLPKIKTIGGNAELEQVKILELSKLQHIGGELINKKSDNLRLENLRTCGKITIEKFNDGRNMDKISIYLPKLKTVFGSLIADEVEELNVPQLVEIKGDMSIVHAKTLHAPKLKRIEGYAFANNLCKCNLQNLNYAGELGITCKEDLTFPKLKTIKERCITTYGGKVYMPELTTAEKLSIISAGFYAPKLKRTKSFESYKTEIIHTPLLKHIKEHVVLTGFVDLNIHSLKTIGEALEIDNMDNVSLLNLESVGTYINSPFSKTINLPKLRKLESFLYADNAKRENISTPLLPLKKIKSKEVYAKEMKTLEGRTKERFEQLKPIKEQINKHKGEIEKKKACEAILKMAIKTGPTLPEKIEESKACAYIEALIQLEEEKKRSKKHL